MSRPDVITLITETNKSHGVHETVTDAERKVLCTVKSVKRSEYYNALNVGIRPEYVFELALAADYQGEQIVKYHGLKYNVIRTYETDAGGIEITVQRSDVQEETEEDEDDGET